MEKTVAHFKMASSGVSPAPSTSGALTRNDTRMLANAVSQCARSAGDCATAIPGLSLHRRQKLILPLHCIYGLGMGLTLQGRKQVVVGDEVVTYSPGQSMVTSVDLPVSSAPWVSVP